MTVKSFLPISAEAYHEIKAKLKFVGAGDCIQSLPEEKEEIVLPGSTMSVRSEPAETEMTLYLVYQGKIVAKS